MSDTSSTVTIRAEMIDDVTPGAQRVKESVRGVASEVKGMNAESVAAGASVSAAGGELDKMATRGHAAEATMSKTSKTMREMHEQTKKLSEGLHGVGDSITERVQYPMQQLMYMTEAATAGMVTFGLVTGSSIQTATLALSSFMGSKAAGSAAFSSLHGLEGPVPFSGLAAGLEQLSQAGMSTQQIVPTLTTLTNLASVSLNPQAALTGMAGAIANMTSTGLMNPSDIQAFSSAGVDIWGMLSRETGMPEDELRTKVLRAGSPLATPGSFFTDLSASPNATTGLAAYRATWAGRMGEVKKSVGDLLATFETPLGDALAGAGGRIDSWATQTTARFKTLGGSLGHEWRTGDMAAFGTTLAHIFGDPHLAGTIDTTATALRGLGQIVGRDVIPMGHDLLTVAAPAFKALADTLGFLGEHRTTTELLLGTLIGFEALSKAATSIEAFAAATTVLRAALAEGNMSGAASAGLAGVLGLKAPGAAGGLSSGALGALGRYGGGALGGLAGAYGAYANAQGTRNRSFGSDIGEVGSTALGGASIGTMIAPGLGTAIGAGLGAVLGGGVDIFKHLSQGSSSHTQTTTINVNGGAGTPQQIAAAVAQQQAYLNQQAALQSQQRGLTSP